MDLTHFLRCVYCIFVLLYFQKPFAKRCMEKNFYTNVDNVCGSDRVVNIFKMGTHEKSQNVVYFFLSKCIIAQHTNFKIAGAFFTCKRSWVLLNHSAIPRKMSPLATTRLKKISSSRENIYQLLTLQYTSWSLLTASRKLKRSTYPRAKKELAQ